MFIITDKADYSLKGEINRREKEKKYFNKSEMQQLFS